MAALRKLQDLSDASANTGVTHIKTIDGERSYLIPMPEKSFSGPIEPASPVWRDNFEADVEAVSPEINLFRINDCLVAPNSAIMTFSDCLIAESLYPYVRGSDIKDAFAPFLASNQQETNFHMLIRNLSRIHEPTLFGREHGEEGYFHWLHSILPRCAAYKELQLDHKMLAAFTHGFQADSVELLGFPKSFINANGNTYVCTELYFCSPMVVPDLDRSGGFFERALYATEILRSVSETVSESKIVGALGASRRIFISRSDAKIRRINNEPQLMRCLTGFGFESVELGKISFVEQVSLFSEASIVVAAHGAGLSNISFMPAGGRVVELLAPDRLWPTYRGIAARSELRYFPYVANRSGEIRASDSDLEVDVSHFTQFVESVLSL